MAPHAVEVGLGEAPAPAAAPAGRRAVQGKRAPARASQSAASKEPARAMIVPLTEPPFTVADLKRAVPAHCFQPTLRESFAHLAWDLVLAAAGVAAILAVDGAIVSLPLPRLATVALQVVAWAVYTFLQGVTMTGLWVLAHECGHGGFSTSAAVNDVVGFIVHTALYVPYFSWQRSHSNHHHYTNNLARDEVFVPPTAQTAADVDRARTLTRRSPVVVALNLAMVLIFGWPLYLLLDSTSHPRPSFANHFSPSSSIFKPGDYWKVVASAAGLLAWTAVLVGVGHVIGSALLLRLYLPPLLVTNAFLVAITFMQHTDHALPHYDDAEWTWLRGALCTVDRTMGKWLDRRLHYIHSTHVCHHLFSRVPFYRAEEATRALAKALGPYYNATQSNFAADLFNTFRDCNALAPGHGGILYFVQAHLAE
jgi:omega-6 fatty acid desaturase / acyl-lipid omega-6 desaturase (Delta-12 desaturase)